MNGRFFQINILFLTDNFPPEGNAPATRTYEHAVRWVKAGHQVTIITCAPNFPDGKVFPGYENRLYSQEEIEGIVVVRVKTYIAANEGFAARILDYMSFMVASFIAGLFQKEPDVIVATSPQFFCAVAGWALSVVRCKPFIFELRDIWPASITAVGAMKDSIAIRILEKIEMFLYDRADQIISVTNSFKDELIRRGVSAAKISVVTNGVDLKKYKPTKEKDRDLSTEYHLDNKFVVGYIGTHGLAHALESIVGAAEILKYREDLVFVFAGGGAAKLGIEAECKKRSLSNVIFIEQQPKEMMPKLWSLCDVSLIHLKNVPLFETVIPSKIFETMGMGLPILIGVPEGEATRIVRELGCGVVVPPENSKAIADAVVLLADDKALISSLRESSLKAASHFSRDTLANVMIERLAKSV